MYYISWTLLKILFGTTLLAILHGMLGCFTFLRKQSLVGDTLAHATLPGVCLGFLIQGQRSWLIFVGGIASGVLGIVLADYIEKKTKLKQDATLGIILSGFFGVGTLLLSIIQKWSYPGKSGLYTLLFGNGSTLVKDDIVVIFTITCIVIVSIVAMYTPLKIATFDKQFAQSISITTTRLDTLFLILLTSSIVVSLPIVGIVLMSSLLIAPAVTARLWTRHLHTMLICAICISITATCTGVLISATYTKMATGPLIVIALTCITGISLILSPHGFLTRVIKNRLAQRQFIEDCLLQNFMLFNEFETYPYKAHDISAFKALNKPLQKKTLKRLQQKGYLQNPYKNFWALTHKGLQRIKTLHHCTITRGLE